jgi:hypothetical protein
MAGERRLCALLYADDIVLLSDNTDDLEELMDCVHEYARQWRFRVNHAKCGLMRFNVTGAVLPSIEIRLGDTVVPWVSSYKYLGVELRCSPGYPYRLFKRRFLAAARGAAGKVAGMGMHSGKLGVPLSVQVYKALVRPLLEYSAEVWSGSETWPDAEELQLAMGKRILQCSRMTTGAAVRSELGWLSMEGRFQMLRVGFWAKLQRMDPAMPARMVYDQTRKFYEDNVRESDSVQEYTAAEGAQVPRPRVKTPVSSLWCTQLHRDLYSIGLSRHWTDPTEAASIKTDQWRSLVKTAVCRREFYHLRREIVLLPKLRTYLTLLTLDKLELQPYLTVPHGGWDDLRLDGRRALTRLRTGTNELRINTGRFEGLDSDDRQCTLCARCIESEQHFLLECHFRRDERDRLWTRLDRMVSEFGSDGAAAAAVPRLGAATLPDSAQMALMTGGGHPSITDRALYRRVMSVIMVEISQWIKRRRQHIDIISHIESDS